MSQEEAQNSPVKGIPWGWVISGLLVVVVTAGLFVQGDPDTVQFYMTASEYLDRKETYIGKKIKVAGKVKANSLQHLDSNHYEFVVEDKGANMAVSYRGYAPDTFKEGSEVVVEGLATNNPLFEATHLMAKCASKYEEGGLPPLEQMRQKYGSNL